MYLLNKRLIFHIDVNNAYLSWTATYLLEKGYNIDLRKIPSVIGGNEETRHGIVLAKSEPAKNYKIQTGETLFSARIKYKNLIVVPPHYDLFKRCSDFMVELLNEYTPNIQRFSCDECFLDFTNMENLYKNPLNLAYEIKDRIEEELGFTVNIGISSNKLLSKIASDFDKPNKVHTLFPDEIEEKMWPLDVGELFGVGRKTLKKLNNYGIKTIGDLANFDVDILKYKLKSYGEQIHKYANGIENSEVRKSNYTGMKGMGNSITTHFDMTTKDEAHMVISSLCETIGMRLRKNNSCFNVVSINYKTDSFFYRRKQKKLNYSTDSTQDIKKEAIKLFDELWEEEPLRQVGVHVAGLSNNNEVQLSLLENGCNEKKKNLDKTIDNIRNKYGNYSISTAQFLDTPIPPLCGGINEDDYPTMSSLI